MNEAETFAEHIDPALAAAGWGKVEGSRVLREHNITAGRLQGAGKRARADISDYEHRPRRPGRRVIYTITVVRVGHLSSN